MKILLYHPEYDRLEYWDNSDKPYQMHDRMMHRNVWAKLEYAMEKGWIVIGTI